MLIFCSQLNSEFAKSDQSINAKVKKETHNDGQTQPFNDLKLVLNRILNGIENWNRNNASRHKIIVIIFANGPIKWHHCSLFRLGSSKLQKTQNEPSVNVQKSNECTKLHNKCKRVFEHSQPGASNEIVIMSFQKQFYFFSIDWNSK